MQTDPSKLYNRITIVVIVLAAIVMAAPSIGGGYLSGDDIQLVRDHYLVNRPSLSHAGQLFTIIHRDLYQPVAMLSLSLDFAVIRIFGLTPADASMNSIAWVAHAHNVGLHAFNALLVFLLLRRITNRRGLAFVAALIFAVHPLNVESVAWISGRMMLLSTTFALLTILAMERWRASSKWPWLAASVGFAALCMMSKVRICLPVLLLIPPLYASTKPARRWWVGWGAITLLSLGFALLNWNASRFMISGGVEHFQGSPIARTILALGWYIKRLIVPVGLSPFHPTDETISWSHPDLAASLLIVAVALIGIAASLRKTRAGWLAALWMIAALAVTLPWIPSRNQLVAERYMYLPMVGACWVIGALLTHLAEAILPKAQKNTRFGICTGVLATMGVALVALSWRAIPDYRSDIARSARILALYPDHPDSATAHAWSLFLGGRYVDAIKVASDALPQSDAKTRCDAKQIIGMSQLALGRTQDAIETLKQATQADPKEGKAHHRLGIALERAKQYDEALTQHQQCAHLLPNFNPGLLRLARVYQHLNRPDDARRVYEQMSKNNPFDPVPTASIAELEIAAGQYEAALTRLKDLLTSYASYLPARINAGVCANALEQYDLAANHFRLALEIDAESELATRGLADSLIAKSDRTAAAQVIDSFLARHPTHRNSLDLSIRNALAMDNSVAAASHLVRALKIEPNAADLLGKYAWLSALANQWPLAEQAVQKAWRVDEHDPYARFVTCGIAIRESNPERAILIVEELLRDRALFSARQFDDFNAVLQACAESDPNNPWPYYVLCLGSSRTDRAEITEWAAAEFSKRSNDPKWIAKVDAMANGSERN
jgi:tetratricopeptide (TPR) repeat protein